MMDRNLVDFNQRVVQIRKAQRAGMGFEATGALGRSHHRRRRVRRLSLMGPVLIVVAVSVILKAAIMAQVGTTAYQDRVDRLWGGNVLTQIGAVLMQPDPISARIAMMLPRLG